MDRLYLEYPVIIVNSWAEAFDRDNLIRFKKIIQARFGEEPFNPTVMHKLSLKYWMDHIKDSVKYI